MKQRRRVSVSATEFRRRRSHYMALCRRADVIICRRGTPVAVLLGFARFQRLAEAAARADEHLRKGSADQD